MAISYPTLDTFSSPFGDSFGLAAAAEQLTWALKTTGVTAPVYAPTYTGPSTFWAPDNTGVYQNVGGLANALGQRVPPIAGALVAATEAQGALLGGEMVSVAADRDFSSDTGFWTKGAGVTIGSGVCSFASVASGVGITRTASLAPGRYYKITLQVVSLSAGGFRAVDGVTSTLFPPVVGTHIVYHRASGTSLSIQAQGTTTGSFDNLSWVEVIPVPVMTAATGTAEENFNRFSIYSSQAFVPYGANTVADEGNEKKITYGNNSSGALILFALTYASLTGLIVGKTYKVSGTTRVSTGASVDLHSYDGVTQSVATTITQTAATPFEFTFVAQSETTCELRIRNLSAGESIWFGAMSLKEVVWSGVGAPLSGLQMVLQPAVTNKVQARKRNPLDTANVSKGGDAASVLSRVLDTEALTAAGLGVICNSGYVYELNNSAGTGIAYISFFGATGNTNPHSAMLHARKVSGAGTPYISFSTTAVTANITSASYTRLSIAPSAAATDSLAVLVPAGCVVRVILPSLTETMAATAYPVVDSTDGLNTVTFTATDLAYPNPLPTNNWQWRTKIKVDGTPATDMWLWSDGTAGVYYKAADSKIYYKHGGGTEIATAAISVGNTYDLGVRQSAVAGASVSLNQVVTTNAAVTANYTPGATLSIGEKGDNTLYFRGRLQQHSVGDFFAFSFNDGTSWFSEDI